MELRRIHIDLDVHRAIERARGSLGESDNDILRRLLLGGGEAGRPRRAAAGARGRAQGAARSRGLWSVEIAGRRLPAANLKRAWWLLLRELDAAYPHFLEDLAGEKARSRRFVARAPADLYGRDSAHLARRHAVPLVGGWYFDSNLSAAQVAKRARIAARLCGLHYGSDVRILDNFREI
jgi:hypothetical protein